MATTVNRLTYDDLEFIPKEREGDLHEIIEGELVVTPSPIPAHQFISANIVHALSAFVREHGLGRVAYAPLDVRFSPDNVLIPDIVFISREGLHGVGPKTVDSPPDLVMEILSPGTRRRDLTVKRDLYARFGVQEYWIIDPWARTVQVLALAGDAYHVVPAAEDGAMQSRVLEGFRIQLAEVFEDV